MIAVLQLQVRKSLNASLIEAFKVWELQVFRTLQDTNNWHLQQGSLEGSELYWLLEFWQIEAKRQASNVAISCIIRFTTSSLLVGVS